jgi:hypothetical protein
VTATELDNVNMLGGRRADLSPIPNLEERRMVWFTAFAAATVRLSDEALGVKAADDEGLSPEALERRQYWRRMEAKRFADKAVADLRLLRADEDRLVRG